MPKAKRTRAKAPDYWSYIFEIEDWEPSYMFSINDDSRFGRGPYWEHLGIDVTGTFIYPERAKGRRTTFTIGGDREIEESFGPSYQARYEPRGVASLTMRGSDTYIHASVAHDALPFISAMIAAARIKFLLFHGESLYRGKATITSMHFQRSVDLADYPSVA
jgi:hypothetical protein